MESLETPPRFSDTISQYQSLLERKNSCPTITNVGSVVAINLSFQQQRLFGDAPQVTIVPEACDGNTTSSQLIAGITNATNVCDSAYSTRAAERNSPPMPHISDLCRTECPLNIHPDSDDAMSIADVPEDPQMSCWLKWWRSVCIPNKTGRTFSVHSSFMHRFRCCISPSGNICCLGRSSSSRCICRMADWPRRRLPNENLLVLSIIQILCGFASIILSSVALTKTVFLYQISAGMWAGLLMLFTGTQGLITARRPISCTLIGLLIFCLLVTLASCALICISVAGIIEDGFLDRHASKSMTSQYRHSTGLPSRQSPEQHYPESVDMTMIFHPNLHINQLPRKRVNGSNSLHWARSHVNYVTRQTRSIDTNLRTCQVILHVLLLLVGIMESSVSLSTSAICYKCLYSWYSQSYFPGHSGGIFTSSGAPLPTSIISFNADTANQAASLLQTRDMQQFAQAGGVLLAVAANSQSGIQQGGNNLSPPEDPSIRPYIHHTAEPFLSDRKTGKALILTEAGSIANAWTAVQAAAALLNRDNVSVLSDSPTHTNHLETSRVPSFFSFRSVGDRNRNQTSCRDGRPRLLLTSLPSPQSHLPNPPEDSPRTTEEGDTVQPNRRTTLLYVMPSPSREEPPVIFPPFPPPYSDLERRPLSNPLRCYFPSNNHPGRSIHSAFQSEEVGNRSQQTGNTHETSHSYLGRLSNRLRLARRRRRHRGNLESRSRPDRHRLSAVHSTRASTLICAGDRILQPVLIVEDTDPPIDPPSYSTIDLSSPTD